MISRWSNNILSNLCSHFIHILNEKRWNDFHHSNQIVRFDLIGEPLWKPFLFENQFKKKKKNEEEEVNSNICDVLSLISFILFLCVCVCVCFWVWIWLFFLFCFILSYRFCLFLSHLPLLLFYFILIFFWSKNPAPLKLLRVFIWESKSPNRLALSSNIA